VTIGVNDYPWASDGCCCGGDTCCCTAGNGPPGSGKCGDSWGCTIRQCTSFVLYRLNHDLGLGLSSCPGNGGDWAAWFAAHGYRVDYTPEANSVVCFPNISSAGHVAFVMSAPTPTTADCEQYNWGLTCSYSQRTFTVATSGTNETRFIHLGTGNPCLGVSCPACQACSAGKCVSACKPGQACIDGLCQTAATPPAPSSPVVPIALAAGAGVLGYMLYRQRSPYRALHGDRSGFGSAQRARPRRSVRGVTGFS
jgi:surface antigen